MCGIVALFSRSAPISAAAVQAATRSLDHRGPDAQRQWISADRESRWATRGSASLTCPPAISPSQRGRTHTHRRQWRILWLRGNSAGAGKVRTPSADAFGQRDRTALYEDLGAQCLHHLRGEFAFVVWDETNRTLLAARDRFGIKPLFYALHQETLYLASEVKALFAAGVPARWDAESVYNSVEFGGHQMRTLYEGVFQIPPGHYLIATEKHIQLNQYWDFNYPLASQASHEAQRRRLRRGVPGRYWRKRCGFVCAPTFRWVATSAADWIPARCWAWRRGIIPIRFARSH